MRHRSLTRLPQPQVAITRLNELNNPAGSDGWLGAAVVQRTIARSIEWWEFFC